MVREARFCWDDSEGHEPPLKHDRIDDFEDDDLLDPDPPLNLEPDQIQPKERPRKRRRRREAESDRRHLAGADWLSDDPVQQGDEAA